MKVIGDSNGLTDNVSDTSNDGDDTDGNTEDDPTITEMEPDGKIEATKTFEILDSDGDGVGDNSDVFPADASYSFDADSDGVADLRDYCP